MNISEAFALSKGMQYIVQKGWTFKQSGSERCELETCPLCHSHGYTHFYIVCVPGNQDGLWVCHKCGKSGHLNDLRERLGDQIKGIVDVGTKGKLEEMPNVQTLHEALLADMEARDYLQNVRGLTLESIKQFKIGLEKKYVKKVGGEVRCIVYPYLNELGNSVWVHWRTIPDAPKAFVSLTGWDARLFQEHVMNKEGLKEITFVEGEINVIKAMQNGVQDIVGVPGANFKKAMWLEQLDRLGLEKIYICYDRDPNGTGKKAAQELASRIGIDKCYKITLPKFDFINSDGVQKPGKDVDDWFTHGGGTLEEWEKLKSEAPKFDVDGVVGMDEALDNFQAELEGKVSMMPKYAMPWVSLSKYLGLEPGDVLDIIAPEKIGKTTFALNLMENFVNNYEEDAIIICMEMTNDRMLRKWVSHVAQVRDKVTFDQIEAAKLRDDFLAGVIISRAKHQGRKGSLYFCNPKGINSTDDMYKLIIDCIRRYGVKHVVVDNIQLLSGRTLKGDSRMIHLDKISKNLASIAKEYTINMYRIVQPHRIRDGELCTSADADGAGSIMKDCDACIVLNRAKKPEMSAEALKNQDQIMDSDAAFERKMLVTIDLSRYSSGGQCQLDYVGETSTVREYDKALINSEELMNKEEFMKGILDASQITNGAEVVPQGSPSPEI